MVGVECEGTLGRKGGGDVGPGRKGLEGVVHDDFEGRICGGGFDGGVGVARELAGGVDVIGGRGDGLVDKFEGDDDVGIGGRAVFLGHGFEDADGEVEVGRVLPVNVAGVAGVVVAILRAGGAVAVDDYSKAGGSGPGDCAVEVVGCAGEVWSICIVESPVADWDTEAMIIGELVGVCYSGKERGLTR